MILVSKTTIHTDDTSKGATIIKMKRVNSLDHNVFLKMPLLIKNPTDAQFNTNN